MIRGLELSVSPPTSREGREAGGQIDLDGSDEDGGGGEACRNLSIYY